MTGCNYCTILQLHRILILKNKKNYLYKILIFQHHQNTSRLKIKYYSYYVDIVYITTLLFLSWWNFVGGEISFFIYIHGMVRTTFIYLFIYFNIYLFILILTNHNKEEKNNLKHVRFLLNKFIKTGRHI